ncbi:MAG: formylglycine-generating enzyme family protein [Spirosomataceae bacterium]
MVRLLFCMCFFVIQLTRAQTITFDDYKRKADACFKTADYACAKQNYERALRIRNEEPYCKAQLQKTLKAIARKNSGPVTPNEIPVAKKTTMGKSTTVEFVLIKGGTFQMGDDKGAVDEKPVHTVTLADFHVSTKEVTVAQFQSYCKATGKPMPSTPNWGWQDNHPVVGVSWEEAVSYCDWLAKQDGKKYRLLTEAEWEYAACGGPLKTTVSTEETGWYAGNTDAASTKPVGTKKANAFGLYDMGGNAAEWCADWYGREYYANSPATNPLGAPQGTRRVVRGRAFGDDPKPLTFRYNLPPKNRNITVGFRVGY